MAVFLIGDKNKPHKAHYTSVLTEPSSYDADITPENMQRGMSAYARGKKLIGTGKCFEYASYGRQALDLIFDEVGNDKYGFIIEGGGKSNLIFLTTTSDGDSINQDTYKLNNMEDNVACRIGFNRTSKGEIRAFCLEGFLFIYFSDIPDLNTQITYFTGKDNKICANQED